MKKDIVNIMIQKAVDSNTVIKQSKYEMNFGDVNITISYSIN
jgi:hypothetical protein